MQSRSIHPLTSMREVARAAEVLSEVWGGDQDALAAPAIRALEHSGNYVVGLFDNGEMVGASVAFFGPPASRSMHSHITGILPTHQGIGWGRELKQHQRTWALERGVGHITWTYDPLVARNAHFNLRVLGARVTEYLVNEYGTMNDGINRGDESDRLLVSWALAAPPAPVPADDAIVASVPVPADIERLRVDAPLEAAALRFAVREALISALGGNEGLTVGGFDDQRGYLLVRA